MLASHFLLPNLCDIILKATIKYVILQRAVR